MCRDERIVLTVERCIVKRFVYLIEVETKHKQKIKLLTYKCQGVTEHIYYKVYMG